MNSGVAAATDAPAGDVLEVAVFGRGDGEAIGVHVGAGRWIAIDSCLDDDGDPVLCGYLRRLGADPASAIRLIVVSHSDSDHAQGIARLVESCPNADVACAAAVQDPDLLVHFAQRGDPDADERAQTAEDRFAGIFRTLRARSARRHPRWATAGTVLWEDASVRVWSLSPSGAMQSRSLVKLVANARPGGPVRLDSRNALCLVNWIEAGDRRVLLGADLDLKPAAAWDAVISSTGRRGVRASLFKVAHHGSVHAHEPRVWDEMLGPAAHAAVTAMSANGLPDAEGSAKILSRTPNAHLAGAKRESPPRTAAQRGLLRDSGVRVRPPCGPLGLIQYRIGMSGSSGWVVRCFDNARPL